MFVGAFRSFSHGNSAKLGCAKGLSDHWQRTGMDHLRPPLDCWALRASILSPFKKNQIKPDTTTGSTQNFLGVTIPLRDPRLERLFARGRSECGGGVPAGRPEAAAQLWRFPAADWV